MEKGIRKYSLTKTTEMILTEISRMAGTIASSINLISIFETMAD